MRNPSQVKTSASAVGTMWTNGKWLTTLCVTGANGSVMMSNYYASDDHKKRADADKEFLAALNNRLQVCNQGMPDVQDVYSMVVRHVDEVLLANTLTVKDMRFVLRAAMERNHI